MFNFNLMNQALSDANVSDKEFRMLYLFVNNYSLNETDDIVMYNGFLMDKLNLSERQVQRLTKSLVEKGYLTKVVTGTSANKNGNIYRLNYTDDTTKKSSINSAINCVLYESDTDSDTTCDKSCDKNVTPYNSIKEYKNNISMYRDHEAEVTNEQVKLSKDELNQRNEYISAVYGKLDDRLNYLYSLKTATQYEDVCSGIVEVISDAQEHRDWFTNPQWDRLTRYCERFDKLTEAKDKYFNGKNTKIYVDESSSIEEDELISTVVNDSVGYVDAKVTSTDEETIPEADIISADDNSTSTELDPWDIVDIISTDDDLSTADRLTLSQLEDKNPPRVPLTPPLTEFLTNVRKEIHDGVYQWSLTLDVMHDFITDDEAISISDKAIRTQTNYEDYDGQYSPYELCKYAKGLMENRINNKDIPAIVRMNSFNNKFKCGSQRTDE